jgi:hypothetical protein
MKIKILSLLIAFCSIIKAYGQATMLYPALKKQVDSLADVDRNAGHQMLIKQTNKDSVRALFRAVTVKHAAILKDIFNKYGFLGYDKVGKQGSSSFWLGVQHADNDVAFQRAVLAKMKVEVERKNANGSNYAYLIDRVNINTGNAQIYGTQMAYKADGTPVPKKLADPENVDKRRKEIGLEPLADYLKFIRQPIPQKK